jgi:hypothetical protein
VKSRKCSLTCFGQCAERGPAAFSAEDDAFGNVLSQLMPLTDWTALTDAIERYVHVCESSTIEITFTHFPYRIPLYKSEKTMGFRLARLKI